MTESTIVKHDNLIEEATQSSRQLHGSESRNRISQTQLSAWGLLYYLNEEAATMQCSLRDIAAKCSAEVLLNTVKSLSSDCNTCVLNTQERSFVEGFVEMYHHLEAGDFNHQDFAKALSPYAPLPLELLWRLHASGMQYIGLYLTLNCSSTMVLNQFSQSLSDLLCEEMLDVTMANRIITDLCTALVSSAFPTLNIQEENEETSKKVALLVTNTITMSLCNFIYSKNPKTSFSMPLNMYECVRKSGVIGDQTIKNFCLQQLTLVLSYQPSYKVVQAINMQETWSFFKASGHLIQMFIHLLVPLCVDDVMAVLKQMIEKSDVNWQALLAFISTFVVLFPTGGQELKGMISKLLEMSFENMDNKILGMAILFARQAGLEGKDVFPSYANWFQSVFGSSSNALIGSKMNFTFFMNFLTELIPHEPSCFLKVHINRPPYVVPKCHHLYSDYTMLARTRLSDLKESDETHKTDDVKMAEELKATTDVENAVALYAKSGKIPSSVLELSMFHKPYYTGKFLPILLRPKILPDVPDDRMNLIDALFKSSKISPTMHANYVESCKNEVEKLVADFHEDIEFDPFERLETSVAQLGQDIVSSIAHNDDSKVSSLLSWMLHQVHIILTEEQTHQSEIFLNTSVPNISFDQIKVVDILLNIYSRIYVSSRASTNLKWAPQFLRMIQNSPCLHEPLYFRLWELLIKQGSLSLKTVHIEALGSFIFHLNNVTEQFPLVIFDAIPGTQPAMPFVQLITSRLSVRTDHDRKFSLRLLASYLQALAMEDNFETQRIPEHFITKFLCIRLIPALRNSSDKQQDFSEARVIYESEMFQCSIYTTKVTFEQWLQLEMQVENDDMEPYERENYFQWIVHNELATRNTEKEEAHLNYRSVCFSVFRELINASTCLTSNVSNTTSKESTVGMMQLTRLLQDMVIQLSGTSLPLPWLLQTMNDVIVRSNVTGDSDNTIGYQRRIMNTMRLIQSLPAFLLYTDSHHTNRYYEQQHVCKVFGDILIAVKDALPCKTFLDISITSFIIKGLCFITDQKLVTAIFSGCPVLSAAILAHGCTLLPSLKKLQRNHATEPFHSEIISCVEWIKEKHVAEKSPNQNMIWIYSIALYLKVRSSNKIYETSAVKTVQPYLMTYFIFEILRDTMYCNYEVLKHQLLLKAISCIGEQCIPLQDLWNDSKVCQLFPAKVAIFAPALMLYIMTRSPETKHGQNLPNLMEVYKMSRQLLHDRDVAIIKEILNRESLTEAKQLINSVIRQIPKNAIVSIFKDKLPSDPDFEAAFRDQMRQ